MPVLDATDLQAISDELAGDAGFLAAIAAQVAAQVAATPVTLADGVTHGGTTALLTLQQLTVNNPSGTAISITAGSGGGIVISATAAGISSVSSGSYGIYGVGPNSTFPGIVASQDGGSTQIFLDTTIGKLDDTLEDDGGTYRFTENALEEAPSGGGSLTAADVWTYGTRVLTAGTNIQLPSNALDNIAITAPAGVASTFREIIVATWRYNYKQKDHDEGAGTIKTYADNGSTVLTTQTVTEVGDTTTVGAAS